MRLREDSIGSAIALSRPGSHELFGRRTPASHNASTQLSQPTGTSKVSHILADKVDDAIGEGSAFHQAHGYYTQGVGPDTATLPRGWQRRLVRVDNPNTNGYAGPCLEVHDLAISKYVAGREKDREFTRELTRHGLIDGMTLHKRLALTKLDPAAAKPVKGRIARDFPSQTRRR